MMDEQKLENYVESLYGLKNQDYRVKAHSSNKFFQVTVEHLEKEGPDLEELRQEILDTVALNRETWELEADEGENYSYIYGSEKFSEL